MCDNGVFVVGSITSIKCYSESIPSSSNMRNIRFTSFFNVATSSNYFIVIMQFLPLVFIGNTVTQTSLATVIITSTIYITTTPSTSNESNVIPVVIGTTITVMILMMIVIMLLLIFIALICRKRTAEV